MLLIRRSDMVLYSPTSTTRQIAVALKFSGRKGMVIEFDMDARDSMWTYAMDCTWISRFKEEDERYVCLL